MGFYSARKKVNMTQDQVSTHLGIDRSNISLWETNRTKPKVALLLRVAKLYGCTVDELLAPEASEAATEQ
ncbi:MAG: helix-turn-helix transcriptional regulator [Evtepia sp.]